MDTDHNGTLYIGCNNCLEMNYDWSFKGKPEEYKIRMTLGILEIEGLIKWTGSKRPIEYKLNVPIEKINVWIRNNIKRRG